MNKIKKEIENFQEPTRNKVLFQEYAITYWPCHYFSSQAINRYNVMVARFCMALPDSSAEFTWWQRVQRWLYIRWLDIPDLFWFRREEKEIREERNTKNKPQESIEETNTHPGKTV